MNLLEKNAKSKSWPWLGSDFAKPQAIKKKKNRLDCIKIKSYLAESDIDKKMK